MCNSNCNSINSVYIIVCIKCKCFYVGETERTIRKRIIEHLSKIRSFLKYGINKNEVSLHFGNESHSVNRDFKFVIFKNDLLREARKSIEADLINIFKRVNANIINDYIPNIYCIKSLSFNTHKPNVL